MTGSSHEERLAEISSPGWIDGVFASLRAREPRLLINNDWVAPHSGRTGETSDPSTGEVFATYALADETDVDSAVHAAHKAQSGWARLTMDQRALCVARLAELISERFNEIAAVDAIDAGLPVARMLNDLDGILRVCRAWPGLASSVRGQVLEGIPGLHYTRLAPYGVVARIVAFNHPILFAVKGSLAALLAGNTIVLKPADQTPMSALLLGDLVREAFPPGVFNVVTGHGDAGAALVTHPLVRRIAFTGSGATGRMIQESAARDQVSNVSLELGGKNPMIVFPDVSVADAARNAVFGMNLRANQGQSCGSTSRVYVHREIHDEFVKELATALSELRLGPAYDVGVDMGPMISSAAADRSRSYIQAGIDAGATLVTGGLDDPRVPIEGHFVAPTLFADVPADSKIANEEIFGPVISLMAWDDYESVIEAANDVSLGLTASVWTNDITKALQTADRLETGYVWINESTTHYFGTPFGGWKDSGVGREESVEEIYSFLQLKSVHVKLPV